MFSENPGPRANFHQSDVHGEKPLTTYCEIYPLSTPEILHALISRLTYSLQYPILRRMKTIHFKEPVSRYDTPRLFCDPRRTTKNYAQTEFLSQVTCNHCRFLLKMPELKATKPYKVPRADRKRGSILAQRRRDKHFDCGAYLFCDQRYFSKKFDVVGREEVTCEACLRLLRTGKTNISEVRVPGYTSARKDLIYVPEPAGQE